MTLFAKNIENELLYIKNFVRPSFEQGFSSIDELLDNNAHIHVDKYTDNIWKISGDLIRHRNTLPSGYAVIRLLSKQQNHLQRLFSDNSIKAIKYKTFKSDERDSALAYFEEIIKFDEITLSPNDPTSIQAISRISDPDEFVRSWDFMAKRNRLLSVENSQHGDCLKFYLLRGKVVSICGVVPAFIVGDGVSSIGSLIEEQNQARNRNVFYESRKIANISNYIDKAKIPEKNEIVRLKHTCDLGSGAILMDLTEVLADQYIPFIQALDNVLLDAVYAEITCYSENFSAGYTDPTFFVRDVKFNAADLRELFACATTPKRIDEYLNVFKANKVNRKSTKEELAKSPVFNNKFLRSATQIAILKEAAYRLGLEISILETQLIKLTNRSTGRSVRFIAGMSSKTISLARDASNNKFLTKQLLDRYGINTPKGFRIDISDKDEAWEKAKNFSGAVVVKPLDGSGGVGVTTDITTKNDFDNAWSICHGFGTKTVLVEENVTGNDYRVIVIGNKVCAVTQRIAAYVQGDGVHTIKELIQIKAEQRLQNPFYRLKRFEENDVMVHFLKKQNKTLTYVPKEGEHTQLLYAVNIGSGGESIDRTEEIHPDWVNIAVNARRAVLNSFHVGLDIMAEAINRSPYQQKWSMIEVNTNPDLGLQLFPGAGYARDVGVTLLSELLGESTPVYVCYKINIYGKVQGVGYRKWFQSICNLRSVVGYVKNIHGSGLVEGKIFGPEVTVDEILRLCYTGPKNAVVRSIVIERQNSNNTENYEQLEIL